MDAAARAARRASRATARVSAEAAAMPRVPTELYAPLLPPAGTPAVQPSHFVVDVLDPQLSPDGPRVVTYHGSADDSAAAKRAQLAGGVEWGPIVHRTAAFLVPGSDDVQVAVISGPLSAVQQMLPDGAALASAAEAGARHWPVPAGTHPSGVARCAYVPLGEVQRPLQVETETRGLARALRDAR